MELVEEILMIQLHPQLKDPLVNDFYDELFKHWRLKKNAPPVIDLLDDEGEDSMDITKNEDEEIDLSMYFEAKPEGIDDDEIAVNDPYCELQDHAMAKAVENEPIGKDAHGNDYTPPHDDLETEPITPKPSAATGVVGAKPDEPAEPSPATTKPSLTPEPMSREDLAKQIQRLQLLDMIIYIIF